ncbi:carboxylesterase/lipase family protein [Sphingomonas sp. PAMC 26605]|uniref:carboxylesterase/lipase family protein n=1 Tax=Sphingomonas sp. PAMC 26605 TaxID=1112214 RepID=UPI0002E64222|nr:carboxylesterase family protein [Sphingomonas sp. PAMC 26605]
MANELRTILVAFVLSSTCASAQDTVSSDRVRISDGTLQGIVGDGVAAFKGIPFAAPPVGPLRWRAPQPVQPWKETRLATTLGASCRQAKNDLDGGTLQSEDCLTLNVWAPRRAAGKRLPVMVWIYGGGFVVGSSASPFYDGTAFARRGVVLVSFNYRLGRFGFFAHPALDDGNGVGPFGNYGIMDQIAALKWVKRNISAFGGDPGNVTIFGESAGAISVNTLMTSPASHNLFAKAISESGFGRNVFSTLASAELSGTSFAKRHGVQGEGPAAAEALRALSADVILEKTNDLLDPGTPRPMLDGRIVRERVDVAFTKGRQARIPYLVGGNSFEASLFAAAISAAPDKVIAQSGVEPKQAVALFGDGNVRKAALNLMTVKLITEPDRFLATRASEAGQPVFRYYFSYVPVALRAALPGATHGAEVPYVFTSLPARPVRIGDQLIPAATAEDLAIADAMQTYWTNFAKTGDPGTARGTRWLRHQADDSLVLEFGVEGVRMRPPLFPDRLDVVRAAEDAHSAP